jgi:hypothetical protein
MLTGHLQPYPTTLGVLVTPVLCPFSGSFFGGTYISFLELL